MSSRPSELIVQSFRNASRAYSDASVLMHEAIARKAGLSGTDHKYLGLIMDKGELSAGQLADLTGLTTGAVTGLIDRLEKKKLVKRELDKNDRRKVLIMPNTPNAIRMLEPLFINLQQQTSALVSSFTEGEIVTIERYFSTAVKIMQGITESMNEK
ncbi:MarR family winged helix-turn-helix transcriptional regulator [Paraflavitalea speifideaquila]|uniref:MarR family winged helix-turn-helix transcriptional regulator n=1 Tax=Paraflavitalea speifideaquila TaxID=3076558 RepID=UPI0028EDD517|nr:MarR family transcriptional regulator [Paraflavitalea speifideiaquila]